MNQNYQDIKPTVTEAQDIVEKYYGIKAQLIPLHGEIDFNFLVNAKDEQLMLKISRPDFDESFVDFQDKIIMHLEEMQTEIVLPKAKPNKFGQRVFEYTDTNNRTRKVRMLHWIEGQLYAGLSERDAGLRYSLGNKLAYITRGLIGFTHPYMSRKFDWDIAQGSWIKNHLHLFNGEIKDNIKYFIDLYAAADPILQTIRKTVIHNDANDNNIIVTTNGHVSTIQSIIDFGDAIWTHTINDLAVAIAYGAMDCVDPLQASCDIISGYHPVFPLSEKELSVLYSAVAMRLCISLTKCAINKIKEPDNKYLQISEQQVLALITRWKAISPKLATYHFRNACGMVPCDYYDEFLNFTQQNTWALSDILKGCTNDQLMHLDLSIDSKLLGNFCSYHNSELYGAKINALRENEKMVFIGGYGEARPIYTTDAYKIQKNEGYEHRTIHLGIDLWSRAGHEVCTPMKGKIISIYDNDNDKDYGPTIIIEHTHHDLIFYTLYGHLSKKSLTHRCIGDVIEKGDTIGFLGEQKENGNWAPHLHFQIILDRLDTTHDFYGAASPSQWKVFSSICPDPNLLLKLKITDNSNRYSEEKIIAIRKNNLGKSLSISYNNPLTIVRGQMQYLIDVNGQKYIDTVNNVAHVGHENPRVVAAGIQQMGILNTNTRYLHQEIIKFSESLLSTLPQELCVLHFVNSGSEANELAMRMARAYTKQKQMIAIEIGYHGNTQGCIDISSYKFNGKGGGGKPEHTSIVPLPDAYRGMYRGANTGSQYANHIKDAIEHIQAQGSNVSAFIAESIVSCGGQIPLPEHYLKQAFADVREAGGLCISDEVQVGFGRVGKQFWGFQLYGVVPDIVTMGKPIGNGHPLGAVACTRQVAEAFANGMEYFNTFGGNPVSCAIGNEVLQVIRDEGLQQNALKIGNYLKENFWNLSKAYPILGDVRGEGLFLGLEFVDAQMNPLTDTTSYIANKMKAYQILMSVDGPYNNVLKIKPPMCFNMDDANYLLESMERVLRSTNIPN